MRELRGKGKDGGGCSDEACTSRSDMEYEDLYGMTRSDSLIVTVCFVCCMCVCEFL